MKFILSLLVMLIMSVEATMPIGPTSYVPKNQPIPKVPAWLQGQAISTPTGSFFAGGGSQVNTGPKPKKPPKWLAFNQQYQSPLGATQPMALTPPNPSGPMPYMGQVTMPQTQANQNRNKPAWLQNFLNTDFGRSLMLQSSPTPTDPYAHPTSTGGNATAAPTSSVLAGDNSMVIGQNQQAYPINPNLNTSSFLAGGGTIANGPYYQFPTVPAMAESQPYSGFGSQYRGWGRRGGGGGGGGGYSNIPAWYLGLNNWNFNE